MRKLQICKFGGTSMGNAGAMRQAADIVSKRPDSRLVVVSATSGTTNQLLQLYRQKLAKAKQAVSDGLREIRGKHDQIYLELGLPASDRLELEFLYSEMEERLHRLEEESDSELDGILSLGERMSSFLFTGTLRLRGLPAEAIDARLLLRTDTTFGRAEAIPAEIAALCQSVAEPRLRAGALLVTQGFIGSTARGETTTLGRGGSDYSAALFAEALGAEECLIWTDVPGMFTMDPRTMPTARVITDISFPEAAEMASFGAKVLHPATLLPAIRAGIRVFVGNTFAPESGGTWISPKRGSGPQFCAVALRERQTLLTLTCAGSSNTRLFLAQVFRTLADHRLSVDVVTTSESCVSLAIDGSSQGSSGRPVSANSELLAALSSLGELQIEENLGLVALIGNELNRVPGLASRAFRAAGEASVRLISHGASPHNLCFLVGAGETRSIAAKLHSEFL